MIKSFLNNKNKDIDVTDEDAFLVITGRLKFFEAFEENDKLLSLKNIIEFIDLPGHNNSKNEFIKRGYYNKILRYTNCCIYVNIPSSIDDEDVQQVFEDQLRSDKDKIYKNLRNQIIDSSVFVINKSDLLILDNKIPKIEKNKNSEKLIKIIEKIYLKLDKEKADKSGEKIISNKKKSDKIQGVRTIKICFFSSEKYFDYLQIYEKYITLVNNNPKKLWEKWYNSWIKTSGVIDFGQYVSEELSKDIIKIKLYINKEDDILKNNLLIAYNQLKQTYKLNDYQNINEIISTIAKINQYLKNYEILEKFYIYMINNNPSEFWEKISYNFTLKDKEKDINLKDFLNNKIKEDKNMLIKTNIWDKYKNNKNNGIKNKKISFQEEKELDLKKNFVKKMKNSFRNILSKYNIELDEGSINNILNDIFEISEALEKKSLFYSNSFFISLRKAIIISNDIQNDNFKNRINKEFLQNLDKLFEKNIELKKIKEKNEINNFISEYKKNNPISEIIKIIEYKIVFISNTKNNIFFELSKILNEEIKDHDKKIKEAKDKLNQQIKEKKDEIRATLDINEKNQLSQELKLLEKENILVFAFNIMVDKMKIIIEEAGQKISKELDSLILEIKNKIEERKKLILNESDSLVSLLEGNLSFFYDVSSAIKNSLIAIFSSFLRGSSVAITSSIVIGGTAGTSFGLPGIIIGVGIGILAGAIELLIKNLRKGKKYEGVLLKIKDQILSNIEDKFNNIITDLTDYKNELENELQSKLTIELNKIKPIDYGRIKEKYEEEKQSILAEMEKIS